MDKLDARWKIIQKANQHKLRTRPVLWRIYNGERVPVVFAPKLLGMKQLQQAVFVCRQNKLVDGATLIEAGFRPNKGDR